MTRSEISQELAKVACEWRVPLERLRGNRDKYSRPSRLAIAARAQFVRKMYAENVATGHVAWALNISEKSAREWYVTFREAESAWWRA